MRFNIDAKFETVTNNRKKSLRRIVFYLRAGNNANLASAMC